MRNPFTNTSDYMIVREFNRLNSKKRSNSSSSQSSVWSTHSSKISGYGTQIKDAGTSSTYERQYLVLRNRPNLYQIQTKRAEVFGIQQLRYKPTYFDNIQQFKSCQKEQQKKLQTEKKIIQPSLKSQKSVKKLKFQEQSKKQISQKKVQIQDKIQQLQQTELVRQTSRRQSLSSKRRGSIVQQMIQLNMDNSTKCNQLYASIGDLKSKHEIFRSNRVIYPSNHKNRHKKSSIFYQQEEFDYKELIKFKNSQQVQIQSQRSRFSQSKRQEQEQQKSNKGEKSVEAPQVITVRNRVYYKYSK